ncbi:MAG: hypothetical protein PHO44_06505 [Sphaerochaetaceae bacterium]|nr:hypothetical protein [Sphaerochaetaceae bacterium]
MGISVHALPPEAFWNEISLEGFAKAVAAENDGCSIVTVLPVEEARLEKLEELIEQQGLEVKRILLKLASEMDQSMIGTETGVVYVCECYDEIKSAQAGARIAAGLSDSSLMIWSVSDFLRTVDSAMDRNAEIIQVLNYEDAIELLTFQSRPLMAQALRPAMKMGITIHYRCLKDPSSKGTLIAPAKSLKPFCGVKCICSMKGITLISVNDADSSIAEQIFNALKNARIDFQLLARAGGDSSLTFSVNDSQASACRLAIRGLFPSYEASFRVKTQNGISIITALGEGMAKSSGMCGKFFGALGAAQVVIRAFSQGLYEKSICAAIDTAQLPVAIRSLDTAFFGNGKVDQLPEIKNRKEVFVGLFGIGIVGTELLSRIDDFNRKEKDRSLVVCYIANSTRCLVDLGGIDLTSWRSRFDCEAVQRKPELLMNALSEIRQMHQIAMVDCTASEEIPNLYAELMDNGINVVAANKLGVCRSQEEFDRLFEFAKLHNTQFGFEATVGAGLPIIRTLRGMLLSGEVIDEVQGVLSGTLSWVLSSLDPQHSFSSLVKQARTLGYCEPDPRTDLSGLDSARKAVIISHFICPGRTVEEVSREELFPADLKDVPLEEFFAGLPAMDEKLESLRAEAQADGKVLRYVCTISSKGKLECGLQKVSISSPLACGMPGDCSSVIYSEQYDDGLCIIGDGAGAGVTCNAIMMDICRIME